MTSEDYLVLKARVGNAGYWHEIDWSEALRRCRAPCHFVREYIFVVINSGMKAQVARGIFYKVMTAVRRGYSARLEFGHPGKSAAIDRAVVEGVEWFDFYQTLGTDGLRLEYLESLPWIGPITKWHLAKNLGADCAKPDRHLVRVAGSTDRAHALCHRLAEATGDRVSTVDLVIWRAANLGWM